MKLKSIKNRSFIFDLSGISAVFVTAQFFSFLSGVLIARYFGPKGKGEIDIIFLLSSYIVCICTFGAEFAFLAIVGKDRNKLEYYTLASLSLFVILATFGFIIFALIGYYFSLNNIYILASVAILIFFNILYHIISSSLYVSGRIFEESILNRCQTLLILVVVLLATILNGSISFLFIGHALVGFFQVVIGFYLLIRYKIINNFTIVYDAEYWKNLLKFGLKIQPGTILKLSTNKFDFFVVSWLCGTYNLGIYSVAVGLSSIVLLVPNILGVLIQQRAAVLDKNDNKKLMYEIHHITSLMLIVLVFLCALFSKYGIVILYGENYNIAYVPLLILLPGVWAWGMWKNLTNELTSIGHPGHVSLSTIIAVVLTLLLDILLVPKFGINAAAFVSTISYIAALIYIAYLYSNIKNMNIINIFFPTLVELRCYFKKYTSVLKLRRKHATKR